MTDLKSTHTNEKLYRWKQILVWERGRLVEKSSLKAGYEKMLLAFSHTIFPFDLYILRYKRGTEIRLHNDPVPGYKHYRINILLKKPKRGGTLFIGQENEKATIFRTKRIVIFRPDLALHRVTEIEEGTRYVLSLGVFRKIKRS